MTDRGDTGSEMNDDPSLPGDSSPDWGSMDDQSIDDLFASPSADAGDLGRALAAIRADLDRVEAPAPNAKLSEYVAVGLTPSADVPAPRTVSVRAKVAALVGTTAGKILLGATVAVAAAGGVQGTGAVDLPIFGSGSEREQVTATALEDYSSSTTVETPASAGGSAGSAAPDSTAPLVVVDDAPADTYSVGYEVPDVGAVTFVVTKGSPPSVAIGALSSAANWSGGQVDDDDADGDDHAEVAFSNGSDTVKVSAEFEDGLFRVYESDSRDDQESETYYDDDGEQVSAPPDGDSGDDDYDDDTDGVDHDDDGYGHDDDGYGHDGSGTSDDDSSPDDDDADHDLDDDARDDDHDDDDHDDDDGDSDADDD